ncbi:MAG: DNA gyrase subunit A [Halobacteria archaeon]
MARKPKPAEAAPPARETVIPVAIEEEMKSAYIDYAMSVIVSRALPDARDGLKPVHRRILYAMSELGLGSNRPYKKSARVVGEVLGKYHPHGDMAVYEALVRMAQDFSLRALLVDGQGNFGSVDGDSPAAMRYTEVRLTAVAEEVLADLEKETVEWAPNFDGSLKEPLLLPSKFPNLLVNGASGIAVGMATNLPPHNLGEVVDGLVAYLEKPDIAAAELMKRIPGPDFPTGGVIHGRAGIKEAYETGRGQIRVRARAEVVKEGRRPSIVITEIPYQVNKANLLESIAELAREKKIDDVYTIRDESDREGMRVVIELKPDANPEVVLNQLYKHTQMETTFAIQMLALVDNEPKTLGLKDLLQAFVDHRRTVVRRRSQFELNQAEKRAHIVAGLQKAQARMSDVIAWIRKAKDPEEAQKTLMEKLDLSEIQAQAILEMRLSRLTALEREKLEAERRELAQTIARLKKILGSAREIDRVISGELQELKEKYGGKRRTDIVDRTVEYTVEDLIVSEEVVVTLTREGYVKRMAVDAFRRQRRGGKGIVGIETREEDFAQEVILANTHDYILFFTSGGKVHWLRTYEIPQASRYAKGKAIVNLVRLGPGERVTAAVPVIPYDEKDKEAKSFYGKHYLFFTTRRGTVKKTPLEAFANPRSTGIIAIRLHKDDELVATRLTDGSREILIASRLGKAARFNEKEVRDMGRPAAGVIGIRLDKKDEVIASEPVAPKTNILVVTEKGYGKRTPVASYRKTRRGAKGVTNLKITDKNGPAVAVLAVEEGDEILVMSSKGQTIRAPAKQVSVLGRATQGVRVIHLESGDRVVAVARVANEEAGEAAP